MEYLFFLLAVLMALDFGVYFVVAYFYKYGDSDHKSKPTDVGKKTGVINVSVEIPVSDDTNARFNTDNQNVTTGI